MRPSGRFLASLATFASLLTLVCCSEPDSTELFVRSDRTESGVYIFEVPMTDSLASYDISFYSRSAGKPLHDVELTVQWLAPSGDGMNETVYMEEIRRSGTVVPYRTGVVPAEYGKWQISVRTVGVGKEIEGLGVICKKEDGTR